MTPQSISQALRWLRQAGISTAGKPLTVDDLFRAAFVACYGKYEPRCEWCISNYKRSGKVPEFLSKFITQHLIVENHHENEPREQEAGTRLGSGTEAASKRGSAPAELLRLWQEWSHLWLGSD